MQLFKRVLTDSCGLKLVLSAIVLSHQSAPVVIVGDSTHSKTIKIFAHHLDELLRQSKIN